MNVFLGEKAKFFSFGQDYDPYIGVPPKPSSFAKQEPNPKTEPDFILRGPDLHGSGHLQATVKSGPRVAVVLCASEQSLAKGVTLATRILDGFRGTPKLRGEHRIITRLFKKIADPE